MTKGLAAFLVFVCILFALNFAIWVRLRRAKHFAQADALHCNIIHEPKSGCPSGYTREAKPRFTEKNGSKQFACVSTDPNKAACVDVIWPGENMQMQMLIEPDEPRKP